MQLNSLNREQFPVDSVACQRVPEAELLVLLHDESLVHQGSYDSDGSFTLHVHRLCERGEIEALAHDRGKAEYLERVTGQSTDSAQDRLSDRARYLEPIQHLAVPQPVASKDDPG